MTGYLPEIALVNILLGVESQSVPGSIKDMGEVYAVWVDCALCILYLSRWPSTILDGLICVGGQVAVDHG